LQFRGRAGAVLEEAGGQDLGELGAVGAVAGLVFEGAAYLCYGGVVAGALGESKLAMGLRYSRRRAR